MKCKVRGNIKLYVTLSSNLEINFVVLNLIYFYSSLKFDYAYSGIKKSNSVNENPQTETQPTTACSRPTTEKLEKMWNVFKVNNKNTRTTSMVLFWCLICVNFEHISHLVFKNFRKMQWNNASIIIFVPGFRNLRNHVIPWFTSQLKINS